MGEMKEILPDFHIYVPILNEEELISSTINALLEVFDASQITVLDLNSTDDSVNRVPRGVSVVQYEFPANKPAGRSYTDMKNEYSRRQKWVFWVDGDEIYTTESLLRLKKWTVEAIGGGHLKTQCYRVYWRYVIGDPDRGYETSREFLYAGSKLFNSEIYWFRRAYPREVMARREDATVTGVSKGRREDFNGVWCWHGSMLRRSSVYTTGDRKKAGSKKALLYSPIPGGTSKSQRFGEKTRYELLSWDHTGYLPWENGYDTEAEQGWVAWNFNTGGEDSGTWPTS